MKKRTIQSRDLAAMDTREIQGSTEDAVKTLLAIPGVIGVDVGFKYKDGQRTDEICLRVHVSKKKQKVGKEEKIPATVNGFSTDVLESKFDATHGLVVPRQHYVVTQGDTIVNPDDQMYPVLMGGITISVDTDGGAETGTIGAIVMDKLTNKPAILTNAHVVNNTVDLPVYHTYSWKTDDKPVGKVLRSRMEKGIDAAVVHISDSYTYAFDIVELGGVQGINDNPTLGMTVRKRGRTSRLTEGIIDGLHGTFPDPQNPSQSYTDIITIAPTRTNEFSTFGDSGSTVLDVNNRIVALLYSGYPPDGAGDLSGKTLAIPIRNVMKAMNVSIEKSDNEADIPASVKVVKPTIKVGARGALVKELQEKLNKIGYRTDTDGVFGKFTRGVVQQFQRDQGLNSDGVVGAKSWAALDAAAR